MNFKFFSDSSTAKKVENTDSKSNEKKDETMA